MRAHLVENGIVTNTVEVGSLDFMPNLIAANEGGIGWLYQNGVLTPPPLPAPPAPTLEEQKAARAEAYRNEADPLFFKTQRGEALMTEWLAKIEEIRTRYPYPSVEVI